MNCEYYYKSFPCNSMLVTHVSCLLYKTDLPAGVVVIQCRVKGSMTEEQQLLVTVSRIINHKIVLSGLDTLME